MKILITGGTGFIGTNLAKRLVSDGHQVISYDLSPNLTRSSCIDLNIQFIQGDILELNTLSETLAKQGVDRIVHLAAFLPEAAIRENPTRAIKCNGMGTNNVFEAARDTGVKRVVYASSDAVNPSGPREDDPCRPTTLYGHLKLLNEVMGKHFATHFGLDTIGLRFGMNYGPGSRLAAGELERKYASAMVHETIEKVALGAPALVPFHESTSFHWTYVKDNSNAIVRALLSEGTENRVFNVCGEEPHDLGHMASLLRRIVPGADIKFRGQPMPTSLRTAEARRVDCSAAREELGYDPSYSLEQGLREYIGILMSNQHS